MHYTHNNVIGLELSSNPAKPVFLGENATFSIQVHNNSSKKREAVWLICDGFHQVFNLGGDNERQIKIDLPSVKRGYLNCSNIALTSQFPLGIFFCWSKHFKSNQRCIVYPQPLDLVPLPDSGENSTQNPSSAVIKTSADDYSGMKAYQAGDRPRDIHWPSLAKTQKLVTIQHEDQASSSVNLSWFSLPATLGTEDKLSQLCFWLIEAEKNATRYQLEMPSHTIQFGAGNSHYNECLSVLALWGEK